MQRVNDAGAATCGNTGNRLRVLQVGIHPRLFVEKKHAQQFDGFLHITVVAGDIISCAEGGDGIAQLPDALAMLVEIARDSSGRRAGRKAGRWSCLGFGHQ